MMEDFHNHLWMPSDVVKTETIVKRNEIENKFRLIKFIINIDGNE